MMLTAADRRAKYKALEQLRRTRLKNLREISRLYDSMRQFALFLGEDPSFVHALCGPNPRRNIGDELARKLEEKLKLETGWLDRTH